MIHQLLASNGRGDVLVGQDLSKFFDSVDACDVDMVLARLGAPGQLCGLVRLVYKEHFKLFSAGGILGSTWRRVTRGLFQGCPLSPLLAAWTALVETIPGVSTASFVDDRFLMPRPASDFTAASRLCAEFDQAFGFSCDIEKCRVGAPSSRAWAISVAQHFQYPKRAVFEALGLSIGLRRSRLSGCLLLGSGPDTT